MIITSVSKNGGLYMVNGTVPVLANQRDIRYLEVQRWLDQGGELTPTYTFTQLKAKKYGEIKQAFTEAGLNNSTVSSLGFTIDADRIAKDNIKSLIDLDIDPIQFRDADNNFHSISASQLHILLSEVISSAFSLYKHKWDLEALVDVAETIDELNSIVW